ncbi:chorismate synthase [Bacillus manliponensis]|uniref:Chorismate synthase n=1 Tax=Bacillus manliponensis TaxID=574376 RepID=A0A073JPS9_9BACI|nr:chorismate synthase [Bacillus manliponensis]
MKSFLSVISATILSAVLFIFNVYSCYTKYNEGDTSYWISGAVSVVFLVFFVSNLKRAIKEDYKNSTE